MERPEGDRKWLLSRCEQGAGNEQTKWKGRKATARVPTPLNPAPASTMTTMRLPRPFLVEAGDKGRTGGDPCGRLSASDYASCSSSPKKCRGESKGRCVQIARRTPTRVPTHPLIHPRPYGLARSAPRLVLER